MRVVDRCYDFVFLFYCEIYGCQQTTQRFCDSQLKNFSFVCSYKRSKYVCSNRCGGKCENSKQTDPKNEKKIIETEKWLGINPKFGLEPLHRAQCRKPLTYLWFQMCAFGSIYFFFRCPVNELPIMLLHIDMIPYIDSEIVFHVVAVERRCLSSLDGMHCALNKSSTLCRQIRRNIVNSLLFLFRIETAKAHKSEPFAVNEELYQHLSHHNRQFIASS